MRSFWKIAGPITCVAVILAAGILWHGYKQKAIERKLADDARVCRLSAEQGDAKAQYDLGHMYYYGQRVPQDYAEAARWYRKAADQANAKAQYGLGYMYHHGQGVPQDYAEAFGWYSKAADQGYAKAQNNLGFLYYDGIGVHQDYSEAMRWYSRAADQGDAMGQDGLGLMYYHGLGVSQDYAEAARWYRKAADQDYAKAQYDLGTMYYDGHGLPQDRAEADRWFHKAADRGDEYAQRFLGLKGPRLNRFSEINLLTVSLGSLLLLIGSLFAGQRLRNRQRRVIALTGLLGLSCVGLDLYGFSHFGVFHSALAANAFYFAKRVLAGVFLVMLLPIVWPLTSKPKRPKILLAISGILFIGFNIFAVAHYDLRHSVPAMRILCSEDGFLIGVLVTLAIFLWLACKNRREQNRDSQAATIETPAEIGRESNQV